MPASFRLLGVPHVDDEGEERLLPVGKAACLLAFLAVRADWVRRDELALLFWPDSDEASARHALRQLLYRARAFPWAHELELRDGLLRWLVDTDVRRFRNLHAAGDWSAAVGAYGGTFLDGVDVADAPAFEAWRDTVRSDLHERYLEASLRAAAALELRRRYREAIETLRAAHERDPSAEDVVQALLRCLALAGERSAADLCFARFETALATHLDAGPSVATRTLIERIRRGDPIEARPHNLPSQTTSFVGRESELEALAERLRRPECRLVTLVGPGGIGKTRLALQSAADHIGAYRHGVYLVPLTTVVTHTGVAIAIAEALELTSPTRDEPWSVLAQRLRERELLIVLDGMEQVLEAGGRLAHLLTRAPLLTVLVTSREPLGLALEWVVPLAGLEVPTSDHDTADVSSLRLFEDAAQRVSPGFSLRSGDRRGAARVCRLVAGVPLAIELAASWTQLLSPSEIARATADDLDFLGATDTDRPERHHNLRTVFEASWARLDGSERAALVRTAVFAGDVDAAALHAVADAALPTVLGLAKRSLLLRSADGRFAMHALVRQYVRERLDGHDGLAETLRLRHLRFYADRVAQWSYGRDPSELLASLQRDLGEVDQAWRCALERAEWDALQTMLANLSLAHDLSARSDRYLQWLDDALVALDAGPRPHELHARILAQRAGCLHRLGRLDEADTDVNTSLALLQGDAAVVERCVALRVRGNVAYQRGDLATAEASFAAALASAQRVADDRLIAGCHNNLGLLAKAQGRLEAALEHLDLALALARRCDDAICSQVLNNLATVHTRRGDPRRAEALLLESIAIKHGIGDHRGLTSTYANLGNLRARAGDVTASEHYHRESMRVAALIDDRVAMARAHTNLGELAYRAGDLGRAIEHFTTCVDQKRANGEHGGAIEAYARLVSCSLATGETDAAHAWALDGWRYARRIGDATLVGPLRDACEPLVDAGALPIEACRDGDRGATEGDAQRTMTR